MPACRKPCCWVSGCAQGSSIATRPASTLPRVAPMVFIAPWRSKLACTRAAKSGSLGSKRWPAMACSARVDVYVNVNYALSGRLAGFLGPGQQGARLFLVHLDLVQVGLQVGHLL